MFTLTTDELNNSFEAIRLHGYSTMIPEPPEWKVVVDNWPTIRDILEKIDLDTYTPFRAMKIFAPKNRANIRVIHLLHPQDLLIYTALVLIAKNDIEAQRVPVKSKRVFSYRVDIKKPYVLYVYRGSYEAYRAQLDTKAAKSNIHFVAIADIADFYSRIYQHRLENVIESVAKTQRVRDVARVLVAKLISNIMERNSYGIPVGPYASRILGEAVLIDVDSALLSHGVDFVRWVDDYNIFCKTEYEAQAVLFKLAEWLFTNHGLTLQSAKTDVMQVERYRVNILRRHERQLTERDTVVDMLREVTRVYEEPSEIDEPSDEAVENALAILQSIDLKGMLETSLADTALVDYEAVIYALTKLPLIPGAPEDMKREVLDLVIDNAELLYPIAEHIAKYVLSFDDLSREEQKRIARKLLRPLKSKRNMPPTYYAMWILHIFSAAAVWNHASDIIAIYNGANSDILKRYAALAIHSTGKRAEALAIKDDYAAATPLLKLAIIFASRKLAKDERKHWKLANSISGGIEKLI